MPVAVDLMLDLIMRAFRTVQPHAETIISLNRHKLWGPRWLLRRLLPSSGDTEAGVTPLRKVVASGLRSDSRLSTFSGRPLRKQHS